MTSERWSQLLKTTYGEMEIRHFRYAFDSAIAALKLQASGVEATVRERRGIAPEVPIPPSDYDEDGSPLDYPFEQEVESLQHYLDAAIEQLRIASIVVLFHAFERQTNAMRTARSYDHKKVVRRLRELGREPQDKPVCELCLFANAAKHGEGRSAKLLREERPDLMNRKGVVAVPATVGSKVGNIPFQRLAQAILPWLIPPIVVLILVSAFPVLSTGLLSLMR